MAYEETVWLLKPSQIQYTQDSIGASFTDGTSLEDTFYQLVIGGQRSVEDIAWISVAYEEQRYWVIYGNRRLFLYKQLEKHGYIDKIRVHAVPFDSQKVGL